MSLISDLISTGYLKTSIIIEAFKRIKRIDFLPEAIKGLAEVNQALPIGQGQTISQPLVVAFMLEELEPQQGQKVLDIGYGSGWTTALLACIVGDNGLVVAVEIIKELADFGQRNVERYNFKNIEFREGDWEKIISEKENFDRIHVACASPSVPSKLKSALNIDGKLVIPVNHDRWGDQSIRTITRISENKFEEKDHPGFRFVPMV